MPGLELKKLRDNEAEMYFYSLFSCLKLPFYQTQIKNFSRFIDSDSMQNPDTNTNQFHYIQTPVL